MGDDWSYVRTAELLAQTGSVRYNGWATTMLGWQLLPAAVLFRWLGGAYFTARMTTLGVAALTAYMTERCFERCGLRARNAILATLVLIASPLFVPLAVSYMSDIYGLFAVVLCLYCCLRAVAARGRQAMFWISAAALGNALGGTARQIAWLGVLVMVPSALWLLRKERSVLFAGVSANVLGVVLVLAAMQWFRAKPYAVPETFLEARLNGRAVEAVAVNFVRLGLEAGMLLLPLLVVFLPELWQTRRRFSLGAAGVCIGVLVALTFRGRSYHLQQLLVPTLQDGGNYVGVQGMFTAVPEFGTRLILLSIPVQIALTLAVLLSLAGLTLSLAQKQLRPAPAAAEAPLSWHDLLVITVPFSATYLLLLAPRAAFYHPFDRYGLALLPFGAVLLTRFYQERFRPSLPWVVPLLIASIAGYSVAVTHDTFALYRGTKQAIDGLTASGIRPTALYAGWEFSGWSQILSAGYVHDPRLRLPEDRHRSEFRDLRPCPFDLRDLFPAVKPEYALAFEPDLCGGPAPFAPTTYRTWLPPKTRKIYVVLDAPKTP